MARELPVLVELSRTATRAKFYDWIVVNIPLRAGEVAPITIRAATANFQMKTVDTFPIFVIETFLAVLNRLPNNVEETAWVEDMENAQKNSVEEFTNVVQNLVYNLFLSADYTGLNTTNYVFITNLFNAFFNRNPIESERNTLMATLQLGTARDVVAFNYFANVEEFFQKVRTLVEAQQFDHIIQSRSTIAIVEGRTIDNVDVVLVNRDNTYSVLLNQSGRILFPARATIGRAFINPAGEVVGDEILSGLAKFNIIDASVVRFTIFSHFSRRGVKVIEDVSQRCLNIYKGPGCDSPDPSPTCSLILDDAVNGCAAKLPAPYITDPAVTNNQPSFRGVPKLASSPLTPVGVGNGPGGWETTWLDPRDPWTRPQRYADRS